jgi:hypothetical protein
MDCETRATCSCSSTMAGQPAFSSASLHLHNSRLHPNFIAPSPIPFLKALLSHTPPFADTRATTHPPPPAASQALVMPVAASFQIPLNSPTATKNGQTTRTTLASKLAFTPRRTLRPAAVSLAASVTRQSTRRLLRTGAWTSSRWHCLHAAAQSHVC